jgi:hypothetical protein
MGCTEGRVYLNQKMNVKASRHGQHEKASQIKLTQGSGFSNRAETRVRGISRGHLTEEVSAYESSGYIKFFHEFGSSETKNIGNELRLTKEQLSWFLDALDLIDQSVVFRTVSVTKLKKVLE